MEIMKLIFHGIGMFYECENLEQLPDLTKDTNGYNIKALEKLRSIEEAFYGTAITSLELNYFQNAKILSNVDSAFEKCENLKAINKDLFKNCDGILHFEATFKNTGLLAIPEELFYGNINVLTFKESFYGCKYIEEVPKNLFKNNKKVTKFESTFENCSGIKKIYDELFVNNVDVTAFYNTFYGCKNLSKIPPNLFNKNINVIGFRQVFASCINIPEIPANLFKTNVQAEEFQGLFRDCVKIEEIPPNLFETNVNATAIRGVFSGCTNIKEIPEILFKNNINVTDFSSLFSNCTSITEIPSSLFASNKKVEVFSDVFSATTITTIDKNIFASSKQNINYLDGAFKNCMKFKLDSITHKEMFANYESVTDFSEIFYATGVDIIPERLFLNCINATKFEKSFAYTALKSIDSSFWGNNPNIKNVAEMFKGCYYLESVNSYNGKGVFHNLNKITNMEFVFGNCLALNSVYSNTFKGCTSVEKIGGAFYKCSNLQNLGYNALDDMKNSLTTISVKKYEGDWIYYYGIFQQCSSLPKANCPPLYDWPAFSTYDTHTYNAFYGTGYFDQDSMWSKYIRK
ncbi:MAG: hypothetical protein J6J60_06500 [Clostridia bacterium]|nr:hypothetical protein [Clostridia bacterium]